MKLAIIASAVVIAAWFAIVVHELGHVVAGWCAGYRFGFLIVGPLRFFSDDGRLRIGWNRNLGLWGGAAHMIPRPPVPASAVALYVAGGPLCSLGVAAVAFVVGAVALDGIARTLANLAGLTSGAVFLATVQPFGTGIGVPSDGGRLLQYLRRPNLSR